MSKQTQQAIMDAFLELLQQKSLDKITVKNVIEAAGVNRNTFYYYYQDIYDLLDSIFRGEVDAYRAQIREESTFSEEYLRAMEIILTHRQAVKHIYNSRRREVLEQYLQSTTAFFVEKFVKRSAGRLPIGEEGISYITMFYAYAIAGFTIDWIRKGMPEPKDSLPDQFARSFDASVELMLKNYAAYEGQRQ